MDMDMERSEGSSSLQNDDESEQLRRGPWTVDEDLTLINYIASHGDGRWNSLARSAGLKRTGKSCRLRWLNYLRPDVRRGNITLQEQLLILDLHSRWGNRWSKIAQYLPGRTDNEIKNYWRTRVQKHAKQLKCDVNSKQFKDTMRYLWMPRLLERIQADADAAATNSNNIQFDQFGGISQSQVTHTSTTVNNYCYNNNAYSASDNNTTSTTTTTDSSAHHLSPISDFSDHYYGTTTTTPTLPLPDYKPNPNPDYYSVPGMDMDMLSLHPNNNNHQYGGDTSDSDTFWDVESILFLQQQLTANNM